jgi:hypothetical protein
MNENILLEKYIRLILENEEDSSIEHADKPTFGDMKSFLGIQKNKKRGLKFLKFAAKVATGGAIGALGDAISLNNITEETISALLDKYKTPQKIMAKLYGINDSSKVKGMSLPSEISLLIDDKIEEKFISHLIDEIKSKQDNENIPENFVQDEFEKYTHAKIGAIAKKS